MLGFLRKHIGMEIPLFLYMLTSFLKYPVFQNLMYEKVCLARYDQNFTLCSNISSYYKDTTIQADANHFYFLSSIVLVLPSLFSTLALGAAADMWSMKVPLLIPFLGLIICTTNYIFQTAYMNLSVYLLLISDAIFGICGGYISIISTTLSYGVKTTRSSRRSIRIAGLEGAIGLGGTIGYAVSGTVRESLGYSYTFLLMLVLQVIAFSYILAFAHDSKRVGFDTEENNKGFISSIVKESATAFTDYWRLLTAKRNFRYILWLNLLALGVELLIFAGIMDIQYSYLRYKLSWGDKQYGWFSGLQYGVTTATVLIVYPLLSIRGITDGILGCLGLLAKMVSLVMLAFVYNSAMAYSVVVFTSLNRFVSTGFRSFLSSLIQKGEQGKMFSLIALLEGVTGLLATAIYNNLYPKTLPFFPGFFHLLSAVLLILPFFILSISDRRVHTSSEEQDNPEPISPEAIS